MKWDTCFTNSKMLAVTR